MTRLAEILVGWPVVASLAMAMTARTWRSARRRGALNEALHELRRPLQSLVLAAGSGGAVRDIEGPAELATVALERLEREINGRLSLVSPEVLTARPLLRAAVSRWQARASLSGGSLELRWRAGEALVAAERFELAQALDNLIVNAIEHGGPAIAVEAAPVGRALHIRVSDSGRASRPVARRETPAELVARLCGRSRRGHGLQVVRRFAARHGGRFSLRCSEHGSCASLELPLADAGADPAG